MQPSITVTFLVMSLSVLALQFGDKNNLNGMPITKVKAIAADVDKAKALAKGGNLEFFVGQKLPVSISLNLHGELTDADCYLSKRVHAYDHAFCAKACVARQSPVVFIADDGELYLALNSRIGMPLPDNVLNQLGVPGINIKAHSVNSGEMKALAIDSVQ